MALIGKTDVLHQTKRSVIPLVFCPAENIPSAGAWNNCVTPVTISLHRENNKQIATRHQNQTNIFQTCEVPFSFSVTFLTS